MNAIRQPAAICSLSPAILLADSERECAFCDVIAGDDANH
jgi:hypothetical protein